MAKVTKLQTKSAPDTQWTDGLKGLFGHTYERDPHDPEGAPCIQYQFRIIREVPEAATSCNSFRGSMAARPKYA